MKKRILSILLAATIVISSISPIAVNAKTKKGTMLTNPNTTIVNNVVENTYSDEEQISEKTNYIFIKTSDMSDIQYSYEENGKTYLVKESSNSDLSNINTEIYEINGELNLLVDSYYTTIQKNDDTLIITKTDDNNVTKDIMNIGDSEDSNIATTFSRNPVSGTYSGGLQYDYINHKYYTLWFNTGSDKDYNSVANATLSVLISIIGAIAATDPALAVPSAIVTPIATAVLNAGLSRIYWSKTYQDLWEVTYPGRQYLGWAVGVRTYTTFYEDSNRKYQVGSTVLDEYHDPVYWPSDMNF